MFFSGFGIQFLYSKKKEKQNLIMVFADLYFFEKFTQKYSEKTSKKY